MPIKYAEITIIRNLKEETIINYFNRLLGNENITNNNDTIIILFDDSTISDVKKEYIDKKFKIGPIGYLSSYPIYFEIENIGKIFFKLPTEVNGIKKLDFNPIFINNQKYSTIKKETSGFNIIYYKMIGNDVFAIVRIKSNEEKPRFLLAFDDGYFKKDDIIYLVNYIFSQSNGNDLYNK
jgi:hypothetical protein